MFFLGHGVGVIPYCYIIPPLGMSPSAYRNSD